MLSISLDIKLDDESEQYLTEILTKEKITISELLKQLLRDRLCNYETEEQTEDQPRQTVLERMGGVPEAVKSATGFPKNLSNRNTRRAIIPEYVQARHNARHE